MKGAYRRAKWKISPTIQKDIIIFLYYKEYLSKFLNIIFKINYQVFDLLEKIKKL